MPRRSLSRDHCGISRDTGTARNISICCGNAVCS